MMNSKSEIQERIFNAQKNQPRILLNISTGVGKSRLALMLLEHAYKQAKDPNYTTLLLVAETAHKKNWQKEIAKWGDDMKLPDNITIECYASLHKYEGQHFDCIIFDECHNINGEMRMEQLNTITCDKAIALSATVDFLTRFNLNTLYGNFSTSTVTLQDAINKEILPTPVVYLIPLVLDDTKKTETVVFRRGSNPRKKIVVHSEKEYKDVIFSVHKYPAVEMVFPTTQRMKYHLQTERIDYLKDQFYVNGGEGNRIKWMKAGSDRKRMLGEWKTPYLKELIKGLGDMRYICFCASVGQSKEINKEHSINSSNPKSKEVLAAFNDKKINNIFCVKMLQEGMNLPDIEGGIITQLDGKSRGFLQKMGRVLRSDEPKQFIFYFKNTQDEKYLQNVLEAIDTRLIKVLHV